MRTLLDLWVLTSQTFDLRMACSASEQQAVMVRTLLVLWVLTSQTLALSLACPESEQQAALVRTLLDLWSLIIFLIMQTTACSASDQPTRARRTLSIGLDPLPIGHGIVVEYCPAGFQPTAIDGAVEPDEL